MQLKKGPSFKNNPAIKKLRGLKVDANELETQNDKNMEKLEKLKEYMHKKGMLALPQEPRETMQDKLKQGF